MHICIRVSPWSFASKEKHRLQQNGLLFQECALRGETDTSEGESIVKIFFLIKIMQRYMLLGPPF